MNNQSTNQTSSKAGFRLPKLNRWNVSIVTIALLMALPVLVVASFLFQPFNENWTHLYDYLLKDYITNSLILMVGVSAGVLSIGITTAWLTSMCEFPGRRFFSWALLLPLAIPAYIIAYTYTGMLDFAGPLQTLLRETFGWSARDYWFPEVRSIGGAILMLSLVLYPYVYMMARAAFLDQSIAVLEASRTLGNSPLQGFYRVALPLARPAIVTGLSLALMETLADYGTVQYFGIPTFTTGIFRTWFGVGDGGTAAQLAALLLGFVFALLMLEKWSRKRAKFHHSTNKYSTIKRYQMKGWMAALVVFACFMPLLLGFIIPALQLFVWTFTTAEEVIDASFFVLVGNSLMLAALAALIAVSIALLLGYGKRLRKTKVINTSVNVASMGYAIPGTVIAVGVMVPFAWLDNSIDAWMREHFDISTGLIFSGTLFALLFAYTVRFLAVSIQAIDSGLGKIKPTMDDAGRSLGLTPFGVLRRIHMPIMRGTVLTALLLVFVDVLKELPATLIMRPFNFNTLAVRAYEMAADERLPDAGAPSLMIVLVGIIPVILLSHAISHSRAGEHK
ncbi:iron ABC transporter permease [Cocleimonas flava]|uniref:Iron(III) transport system permease protein n=1 Tax=Cocleimonas flava TaxID=634765 RepID=A0A4R1FE71_9GAMM|nr:MULTISPECIES: iron ABC transporter permease [Cocleimonas]MEB8431482.1 iron ABC transporter permease [Cocleimonas sp. KMM 6892]MEC4713746.1 iron ABC transporter permease [Cocleimonas sp. KMM 6895]MEC4743077.1 iron ABC transporter permease [Cocleimonas sp. KMM 6896]TCJ89161.1 iron(III) transport system permease protein [Cocleimonas flava]